MFGADLALSLLINGVFALICGMLAHSRGRNIVGWALLGFVFGCFALIILLVIPDLKVEEERQARLLAENRRLREMVRADRQLADQRHADSQQRFSAHDRALGLDTRPAGELPEREVQQRLTSQSRPAEQLGERRRQFEANEWYFLEGDDKQVGPLSFQDFRMRWRAGELGALHYVWSPLFDNWQRLGEVDGLEEVLRV